MPKQCRFDFGSIATFDTARFPFRTWFEDLFANSRLEQIHAALEVTPYNYSEKVSWFQRNCEASAWTLRDRLDEFFTTVIEPQYGKIASRQPIPTFRSHFAVEDEQLVREREDYKSLGPQRFLRKHYFDNYRPGLFHRDADYGLRPGSLNLWLPVTAVSETNSVWVGGPSEGGADALPVSLRYGECLFFDGAQRWHGAVWNTSQFTRISFDIRFLPAKNIA